MDLVSVDICSQARESAGLLVLCFLVIACESLLDILNLLLN